MRRRLSRDAMAPIRGQLVFALLLVVVGFVLLVLDYPVLAVGSLAFAFLVVGGAKRAR